MLVADGLETPGNLGTLIRTLDACAADALVVTDRRTPVLHPKVFRASHGASLSVPHVVFDDTDAAAAWLAERGFSVLLADTGADAVAYRDADWSGRIALVLGNERYGVSPAWRASGARAVAVPMLGRGDSLNAAVAASVLLFEARARQGAARRTEAGRPPDRQPTDPPGRPPRLAPTDHAWQPTPAKVVYAPSVAALWSCRFRSPPCEKHHGGLARRQVAIYRRLSDGGGGDDGLDGAESRLVAAVADGGAGAGRRSRAAARAGRLGVRARWRPAALGCAGDSRPGSRPSDPSSRGAAVVTYGWPCSGCWRRSRCTATS